MFLYYNSSIFTRQIHCKFNRTEAVAQRCSAKKVFLESLQNLQENICARVSFLIKLQAWGLSVAAHGWNHGAAHRYNLSQIFYNVETWHKRNLKLTSKRSTKCTNHVARLNPSKLATLGVFEIWVFWNYKLWLKLYCRCGHVTNVW